jgi:hypothetical protein
MPALIGFSVASPNPEMASQSGERVEVQEDAETVVKALSSSEDGFAKFQLAAMPDLAIWVNRDNVMFVRETGSAQ